MITLSFDTCFDTWESLVDSCVVLDDRITAPSGRTVPDSPFTELSLGVRAYNVLMRARNELRDPSHQALMISDILRQEPWKLFRLRNLGVKSAWEVISEISRYLESAPAFTDACRVPAVIVTPRKLLSFLSEHEFDGVTMDQILETFPGAVETQVDDAVSQLIAEGTADRMENRIIKHHRSFFQYAFTAAREEKTRLRDRHLEVLRWRMMGSTLQDIGDMKDMSRERIRQIEQKTFNILTQRSKELFAEDAWKYLFTTYAVSKELLISGLKQPQQTWYYLSYRYKPGMLDIRKAVEDQAVPSDFRALLQDWVHSNEIQVNGRWIPRTRAGIEDYLLETCCREDTGVDEFFALYERFTVEYGLDRDEKLQMTDSVRRTRMNRLADSNKLLWKQGRKLRYYNIAAEDFTELLQTLDLARYHDIEISTLKLVEDYPDLMRQYDIRDEYELHNLLKKLCVEEQIPGMKVGRMPGLQFGTFDRDEAVREILFAMAPVSIDDLTGMIHLEYGFTPETIKANWLKGIADYYHQGMYSVDYETMPEDQMQAMRAVLTDDFYNFAELRDLYVSTVASPDLSLLSSYNLKRLGFLVGTSYVVRNWPSAEAYFEHVLMDSDKLDLSEIHKRYEGIRLFICCLTQHRDNLDLIEYEPWKFINVRLLKKSGFDRDRLSSYGDRVLEYVSSNKAALYNESTGNAYFTVASLKKSGFLDETDMLGFGNVFCSSLLRADKRFSWQRIGGAVVLNLNAKFFDTRDFLRAYVEDAGSVSVKDLQSRLAAVWGIELERDKILEKGRCGDTCYDPITDKLYADCDLLAEERKNELSQSA